GTAPTSIPCGSGTNTTTLNGNFTVSQIATALGNSNPSCYSPLPYNVTASCPQANTDATFASYTSCNPADTGVVVLNLTNQLGCDSIHTITTTLNPIPTPSISGNTTLCPGTTTTLTASGGGTYSWSTGPTTASITVSSGGTYTVTVTNASGCTASASHTVTMLSPPVIFSDVL